MGQIERNEVRFPEAIYATIAKVCRISRPHPAYAAITCSASSLVGSKMYASATPIQKLEEGGDEGKAENCPRFRAQTEAFRSTNC